MKWHRMGRHSYQALCENSSAHIFRDPSKEFWWWGARSYSGPYEYKKAPNKAYAKRYAHYKLVELLGLV